MRHLRKYVEFIKRIGLTTTRNRRPKELDEAGLEFVSGPTPNPSQEGWYVFTIVRNELLRLPYFLQYYREMGANLFVVADNGSNDGTTEYLMEQPDVLLFRALGSYLESRWGIDWLNALLHRFGQDRWCLSVDADELLVFPHCEQFGLSDLTSYLDTRCANALPAFLLDMYSREPIREANYQTGTPFLSTCPFFDATGYRKQNVAEHTCPVPVRGGPRHRLFWEGYIRKRPSPFLLKIPLVRWSGGLFYEASTHKMSSAQIGDLTGALLHFKLFADFPSCVEEEVIRKEHFNGASQYSAYMEVFLEQPGICAFHEDSIRYEDSHQLVELGLINTSASFEAVLRSDKGIISESGEYSQKKSNTLHE